MANSNQILSLITSHVNGDDARFKEIALQVASTEAKAGHTVLSRSITDALKKTPTVRFVPKTMSSFNAEFTDLFSEVEPPFRIQDLISTDDIYQKINRVLSEYARRELLSKNGLDNRSKLLLTGPSGTGKTMTASIIANELHLPLYVVRLERIITKYMGETSLKLSRVFDLISTVRGVYLFDEFDAIGTQRGNDNEVGEMRRILNTFLQLLERNNSDSIIIAATNCPTSLDKALFRRFDDILEYADPTQQQREKLVKKLFASANTEAFNYTSAAKALDGYSHALITAVCRDAIKESILTDKPITDNMFHFAVNQSSHLFQQSI